MTRLTIRLERSPAISLLRTPPPAAHKRCGWQHDQHHRDGDEDAARDHRQLGRPECRDRPEREDPGLGVDRLECRRLQQAHRPGDIGALEGMRSRHLVGQEQEIHGAHDLHHERDLGDRRHERPEPRGDRESHRADPERRPDDLRDRPAEPERGARCPQQDVVRAGRDRTDEREREEATERPA